MMMRIVKMSLQAQRHILQRVQKMMTLKGKMAAMAEVAMGAVETETRRHLVSACAGPKNLHTHTLLS